MNDNNTVMLREITKEEINRISNNFTYHAPSDNQPKRYEAIRMRAKHLAVDFCQFCPPSRELSLALTKLEEAVFWANAAIARNEDASTTVSTPPPSAKE